MPVLQLTPSSRAPLRDTSRVAAALVANWFRRLGAPPIRIRLWNGRTVGPESGALACFGIRDARALWRLLADPESQFGELYATGRIVLLSGDLARALDAVFRCVAKADSRGHWLRTGARRWRIARSNTLSMARRNVAAHYDLGNDFYRLWLDPTLSYTCAYFENAFVDLERAQHAKLDLVCRKLRLQPDEAVIEAGCGWGGFALHAARYFGVRVRAFNISREQITYARAQARRAGLADRVEFIDDDYRNCTGSCDAFVSIGMLEHVGLDRYEDLGSLIRRLVSPAGRGLVHSIGRNAPRALNPWIERRIFPGAYAPSLAQMLRIFEPNDLSVIDVENLRPHYALTLRHWADNFSRHKAAVAAMFDESFTRMWELYLASSQAAFTSGQLQLYQVLFAPAASNRLPMTRADIFGAAAAENPWTPAMS